MPKAPQRSRPKNIKQAGNNKSDKNTGGTSQLRIIGGQWRSRKLQFTSAEGLRPTGDRIRETLFNWLAAEIPGAHCLDLFAGSGALGIEALSRGAASCDFVELNHEAAAQIRQHLSTLNAEHGQVFCQTAKTYLENSQKHYDIIFLDPPFNKEHIDEIKSVLNTLINKDGLIYLEHAKNEEISLPENWTAEKQKTTGEVVYSTWRITC
ncbi:16S rRNA (guanine(966)-N(2))-methyltransferase RsmD [Spongiibacter sp. KMU-158]|uniref:Ribosomal RNA small subunit methyltransferase D n=1 Tax=Spongiibacter pelagi TaxID=2760804 RepID=A0A927C0B3_9GAMM|nr:16S rRNA (guanine(966)-N(2))-methyltransferase RsmD [Spongiibacter pelagi]MBD2857828.1 16S rRNA (guanine(966)-N(2))-methyltransferase RsmD [Spongiibacter pelagi]